MEFLRTTGRVANGSLFYSQHSPVEIFLSARFVHAVRAAHLQPIKLHGNPESENYSGFDARQ